MSTTLESGLSKQPKNPENQTGGGEISSEQAIQKLMNEFAILKSANEDLARQVQELQKPLTQKAREAAQKEIQRKTLQVEKLQMRLNKKKLEMEQKIAKGKESLIKGTQNNLQRAGDFAKNDAKETWKHMQFAGQKIVEIGKKAVEIDRIAGQKVDQVAKFAVQGSYSNVVAKPSRFVENVGRKIAGKIENVGQKYENELLDIADAVPVIDTTKSLEIAKYFAQKLISPRTLNALKNKNLPKNIKTLGDYLNFAKSPNSENGAEISQDELTIIDLIISTEISEKEIKGLESLKSYRKDVIDNGKNIRQTAKNIASPIDYIAKTDVRDVMKDAKNKLKNLFGKKNPDSKSQTN